MADTLPVTIETITYALAGGVLPTLVWLWYWLKEDKIKPEPRSLLVAAFLAGAAGVLLAYVGERLILLIPYLNNPRSLGVITVWATIEEVVKFGLVYMIIAKRPAFDEPIDAMIYLITAALGFAAAENALYLVDTLSQGSHTAVLILTGNLRFLGASLLHVVSSAIVGAALALVFCTNNTKKKTVAVSAGLIIAILLHAIFNLFILTSSGGAVMQIFLVLWLSVVLVLLLFERVKSVGGHN